jgi:uncharacterized membrane protein YesL
MLLNDPSEGLVIKISEWIVKMATINLIWISLTMLGGVIFGWAPATVAIMSTYRAQRQTDEKVSLWKTAWKEYRQNFFRANIFGLFLKFGAILLIFYSFTLTSWDGALAIVFGALFFKILLVFTIVAIMIFPVFIHFQAKIFEYFRLALTIGISHLHLLFAFSLCMALWWFAFTTFPGLSLIFAASLPLTCLSFFTHTIFDKIEMKKV